MNNSSVPTTSVAPTDGPALQQVKESNGASAPPQMVRAHKRHRIASIALEIARLKHEQATLREELAKRD